MNRLIAALLMCALGGPAVAQDYVGDAACGTCHAELPEAGFFDGYMRSGHPWKVFRTQGEVPDADTWPHTPVPPLPVAGGGPLQWSDVEYVIGNFYWKTRFVARDGYIWTGLADETTQWNIATQEWVPYHAGEIDKPFDCGRCHTTGYDPAGNQHGLPGLIGTWAQDGVRCEACHGPGSEHAGNPSIPPPGGIECAGCHYRDAEFRMPWSGEFMRHHQQSEDLSHSAHKDVLTCESCHNPHRSVVYNDGGMTMACTDCHPGEPANGFYVVEEMESLTCEDCHMPFMGKSAVAFNAFTGDIRGHLFQILTEPIAAEDNTYVDGGTFWNQDAEGNAFATLDYACLGCHLDIGEPLTLEDAAVYAQDIHTAHPVSVGEADGSGLVSLKVMGNPFQRSTRLTYSLPEDDVVRLTIHDVSGRTVAELLNESQIAGDHETIWDATGIEPGVYFFRLRSGVVDDSRRVVLVR